MAFDASMADERAARLLAAIPEDDFILKVKYLNGKNEDDWALLGKFDPVRAERKRGKVLLK